MLATDENNPDFVGARNPDDLLRVRFYEEALHNAYASQDQGHAIFDNVIMIEICTPGSILNIVNRAAVTGDKIKWPRAWAFFEANTKTGDRATQGTPLAQWPLLNKAQAEMLRALKFFDVEQIAGASDEQLQHLGMSCGMQPMSLRDKARAYLNVAKNAAYVDHAAEALKATTLELEALKAKDAQRDEQFAAMQAQIAAMTTAPQPPTPQPEKPRKVLSESQKAAMAAGRAAAKAAKQQAAA